MRSLGSTSPTFDEFWLTDGEAGFGYIHDEDIAPILIGEFGTKTTDSGNGRGPLVRQLVTYMGDKGMNWTYWSWNPNSGDTGGILKDDWTRFTQTRWDGAEREDVDSDARTDTHTHTHTHTNTNTNTNTNTDTNTNTNTNTHDTDDTANCGVTVSNVPQRLHVGIRILPNC